MRRILYVTDFYAPFVGGVEQHVRSLAHAVQARGHDVAVVTQRADPSLPAYEEDGPVRVHRITTTAQRLGARTAQPGRPWAPPALDPGALVGLRRVVQRERPDVVHGHDWLGRSVWPLCLGRRALVVSLHYYTRSCATKALMQHGTTPCSGPGLRKCLACASEHYGTLRGPVVAAANRVGAAIDDRVARATIGVSEATLRGNGLASGGSISVIPNLLPDAVGPDDASVDIPALPDEPYLLFVGDLRAHKGLDVLLAAYRRLTDPPPLVLVGEIQGAAVADFPPGVVTVGAVPNAAVATAWRRALVGIVPSIWPEPFGIVVLEAMTVGCPVVASAIGGIPEIITDDVDGVLVPPSDPLALADALTALLADGPRRARLGAAARATSDRYRSHVVAAEAEAVYEQALAARRG